MTFRRNSLNSEKNKPSTSDSRKAVLMYLASAVISACVFIGIYGIHVIDPTDINWLMSVGGDMGQHYIGWYAYRKCAWMFPLGLLNNLAYPTTTSIIFTDSIPGFALFFKLLSPLLPETFQYFGIWGLMCFMLQGMFATRILKKSTNSPVLAVLGGTLFLFSPVMIYRMFRHTALAAHWILLYALYPLFYPEDYQTTGRRVVYGILLAVFAVFTHIYFTLFCGIILAGFCLEKLITVFGAGNNTEGPKSNSEITNNNSENSKNNSESVKNNSESVINHTEYPNKKQYSTKKNVLYALFDILKPMIAYVVTGVVLVYLIGGFSSGMEFVDGGLGEYSANLNALFNPIYNYSTIIPEMPNYSSCQREGIAYMGCGVFLAVIAAIVCRIYKTIKHHTATVIGMAAVFVVSFLIALSPVVTFMDHIILQIPIPGIVFRFFSIFRASGRLMWIPVYMIMLVSLGVILRTFAPAGESGSGDMPTRIFHRFRHLLPSCLIIIAVVILQIADMSVVLKEKRDRFFPENEYESFLQDTEFWNRVAENGNIRHFVFYDSQSAGGKNLYDLTDWALKHEIAVSQFYFARSIDNEVAENLSEYLANPSDEDLYIFNPDNVPDIEGMSYYEADGLVFGYFGDL